ncbi:MAG: hypothetical protein GX639_00730 [Fibrobacter sp.]|nr:hypothetical protein [Fibrobacter sp.]
MITIRTVLFFCLCLLIASVHSAPMVPIKLENLTGTVNSIYEGDFCSVWGKAEGVCSSKPGYEIILKNVDYEVIQGPNYPDYEKGITHHKDSFLIYSTDTLFRTLVGKTISISKYYLSGDEFSLHPSIETLKITSAISIKNTSMRSVCQKQQYGVSIQHGLSKKEIHNYKMLLINGRSGGVSSYQNAIKPKSIPK